MPTQKETYYRLTEENSWEGETWYHYFVDQPGVKECLTSIMKKLGITDFTDLRTVELSDEESTILANIDGGYMRPHWFGELDISELSNVDVNKLYKGGIRDYAEDLFETSPIRDNED